MRGLRGRWLSAILVVAGLVPALVAGAAEGPGRRAAGRRGHGATVGAAASSLAPAEASPSAAAGERASPGASRRGRGGKTLHGTANLNQADQAVLELLPGIGQVMAQRILEHRKAHPFRKVDDLTKVKGIGRKKLAKLRPFLSVAGPSTLAEDEGATPSQPPGDEADK
jgi:competence protein ComEA